MYMYCLGTYNVVVWKDVSNIWLGKTTGNVSNIWLGKTTGNVWSIWIGKTTGKCDVEMLLEMH